ncbi:lamin tail domain-containing protein [Sporosarcina sp. USHLN248]|uniref:lamin tail domain-containing protein n=1 Tax=Sporosarcina sp. USHLN248 TaxID=3081300 RepID=UPI0030168809
MTRRKWKRRLNGLLSIGLVASLLLPAVLALAEEADNERLANDLLISEYVEGSGFNKAIELYNGTGAEIDLSAYTLELYANGAVSANSKYALSGMLANDETIVLYHRDAVPELKSKGDVENSTVTNFNGDDAIVLKKFGSVIDSFGQVGERQNWGTDVTLVRKPGVLSGDTIEDDPFNRDDEWIVYPKDTFDYLGFHKLYGDGGGEEIEQPEPAEVVPIGEARNMELGATVTVKGIVAANLKNTISVQDATGGIAVRPTSLAIAVGDEVTLTGKLADYRGLLQLEQAKVVENAGNVGNPTSKTVTGAELGEAIESQLVTIHNVVLSDVEVGGGWANYLATDGHEFIVRDETATLDLTVGTTYDSITGIVQQFDDAYQIIPRSAQDIVIDSTVVQPVVASPDSGTFVGGVTVSLETYTPNASILYTLDGLDPIENGATYAEPIFISEDTAIKAVVKTEDGRYSDVRTFTYRITESLKIHDIQGSGHVSPFNNQMVEGIEGIVTYKYELNGSTYYHIQTPDDERDGDLNTSEAVVLYSGKDVWKLSIGDLVSVTGQVSEYAIDGYDDRQQTDLKTTQINIRDDRGGKVEIVKRNVPLPKPFIINEENLPSQFIASHQFAEFDREKYAADFWESREAMIVQVGDVKAVGPQQHGDLVTVFANEPTDTRNGGILLEEDDANANRVQFRLEPNRPARDFEVATGDYFNGPIQGVVGYSYQNYKIYTSLDEMKKVHVKGEAAPETTTIVKADDKLTIASYNLENFSNNRKTTTDDKARKLARAFAVDMQSPDIVGVTEVQDNNGPDAGNSSANESYERLIKAIADAGGANYEYVNIDPVNNADGGQPNANIRVGFLYNPDRVKLSEGMPHGDATTSVGYENGKLTLNPGRIDPNHKAFNNSRKPLAAQFEFQGESVVVIVNHWNSKNGDTPLFGAVQPPINGSEVQRKQIAEIVYRFIRDIKTDNPNANIVSLGDFNDFQFSDSLKIHEGDLMTNLINHVEKKDRYSYVFQGNSQVLDHILVSNNLVDQALIDILHINADFTDMAGRASDHDPVMVQISFEEPVVWEPVPIKKTYTLIGEHKKKLNIAEPSVAIYMDGASSLKEGVYLKGDYAELTGEGFKTNLVIMQPKKKGLIVDLKGTEMGHIIVEGDHPLEIRGAENIHKIDFVKGADSSKVLFYNSKGKQIELPVNGVSNVKGSLEEYQNI